jgi:hypothetical protein
LPLPDWLLNVLVLGLLLVASVPSVASGLPSVWARLPAREVGALGADTLAAVKPGTRLLIEGVAEPAWPSASSAVAICRDDTTTASGFFDRDCSGEINSRLSVWGPATLERRPFVVRVGNRAVNVTNASYRLRFASGRAPDLRSDFGEDARREFRVRSGALVTVEGVLTSGGGTLTLRAREVYEGGAATFRRDWENRRAGEATRGLIHTVWLLVSLGVLAAYAAGRLPWLRPRR